MFVPTPHPALGGAPSDTYARVVSKRRTGGRSRTDRVHTITSTQGPLGEDIDRRARRYLFQMSLRTVCFLGAVFTWGHIPTPVSAALLVSAVVLPYVAVVLANAGRERPERADSFLELREIAGAPVAAPLGAPGPVPPTPAPAGPAGPVAGDAADDAAWADATWTDPPWDEPQWRDARWDDPTGTARPDGSGRG